MKVIKTENRFKTGFQQPKSGFPKYPVLTSLITMLACVCYMVCYRYVCGISVEWNVLTFQ